MKFFATAVLFAATAMALPGALGNGNGNNNPVGSALGSGNGNGDGNGSNNPVSSYPIGDKTTLQQAQNTCGNDAQVSCCDTATYTHDITNNAVGPLAGVLQSALSGGPGSEGLGLFGQCSDLSASAAVLGAAGLNQLINQKCKQNIACCQGNSANANNDLVGVAVPCVALGSLI
ncbi:conidial hydrophobin Hyp1/RodA [Penicillium herquei]|nr:conidial hydrophobin Hyp1/RodA [Penicillium herquei]